MRRKSKVYLALLFMIVGFASVATTLFINGSTLIAGDDSFEGDVYFTNAYIDGGYSAILEDGKQIRFYIEDLKSLNQTAVLEYTVTNNSQQYDAEVDVICDFIDEVPENDKKYISFSNSLNNVIAARSRENGTVTMTLNQIALEEIYVGIECILEVNALERDAIAENELPEQEKIPGLYTSTGSLIATITPDMVEADYDLYEEPGVFINLNTLYSPDDVYEVVIPEGTTRIGNDAFWYFSNMEKISIPDSVTTIGAEAFRDCRSLESIIIPDSVVDIDGSAFNLDSNLTNIQASGTYQADGPILYKGTELIAYPSATGDVVISEGITKIGDYAFYKENITSVKIPSTVTEIGERAFSYNQNLTSIIIPSSVKIIGSSAFLSCSKLKDVTIENGVEKIEKSAFNSCSSLTSINIPDSVTTIGDYAFSMCGNLESIILSNNLISIGDGVFGSDTNLINIQANGTYQANGRILYKGTELISYPSASGRVEISEGTTKIGVNAFRGSKVSSVVIPNTVTEIGDEAFSFCSSLKSITIPDSVTTIGEEIFYYDSNLINIQANGTYQANGRILYKGTELVSYPSASGDLIIPGGITKIGKKAFWGAKITSVVIPEGVTTIEDEAFCYNYNLESAVIPSSVTEIKGNIFVGDYKLENIQASGLYQANGPILYKGTELVSYPSASGTVVIPNIVTKIGKYAFSEIDEITSITIPNSVSEIDDYAFAGVYYVDLKVPNSVTKIGENAFTAITHVYYQGSAVDNYPDSNGKWGAFLYN